MKKVAALAAAVLITITLGVFVFQTKLEQTSHFAMGSILEQSHWKWLGDLGAINNWSKARAEEIYTAVAALENELNTLTEAPALALEIAEASGGAFSPYLGAVTALWNIDSKDGTPPCVPSQEELDVALLKKELDLGAYGKGAACDEALRILLPASSAVVINLGGNIFTYGGKPLGQPFQIALRDPKGGMNDTLGMFTLKGIHFISTSGSYEKQFERDGKRYHHIFDPKTGYPAEMEGLISVTVVTGYNIARNGGALGDMLSTACFVLGYDGSRELLQQYNADAIFIYESGEVRAAGNVRDYFRLKNLNYHWSDE